MLRRFCGVIIGWLQVRPLALGAARSAQLLQDHPGSASRRSISGSSNAVRRLPLCRGQHSHVPPRGLPRPLLSPRQTCLPLLQPRLLLGQPLFPPLRLCVSGRDSRLRVVHSARGIVEQLPNSLLPFLLAPRHGILSCGVCKRLKPLRAVSQRPQRRARIRSLALRIRGCDNDSGGRQARRGTRCSRGRRREWRHV